jgi:two-component system, response regulator, stage 0 sporulation protein F
MNKIPVDLMIVDDEEMYGDILCMILKKKFNNIISCVNGIDALELLQKHSPDVIILDINIPGINGIELAREIRRINKKITIISLSGFSTGDVKSMHLYRDDLFDFNIVKPFMMDELISIVSNLRHKTHKQLCI